MATKIMDYAPHLRLLLGRLDAAYLRADDNIRPKIDARRSIVRADLHDRSVGSHDGRSDGGCS